VRSYLILNSPWQGTGNRSWWSFSGAEDRALRNCLDRLDSFATAELEDRWTAAIVFGFLDRGPLKRERAWTIEGAMTLAELLPESLADLRDDVVGRFANRVADPS
jgi:hypothetical protein